MSGPTIFISAGEASGELYGAMLVEELPAASSPWTGSRPAFSEWVDAHGQAGLRQIVRSEDMAVMGITEVIRHLPRIYREYRKLKSAIRTRRPVIAILIDFPDIHFRLAEEFHRLGIPVIFFVSPQIWAWKRTYQACAEICRQNARYLSFEEPFYREHGVSADSLVIRSPICHSRHHPRALCPRKRPQCLTSWIALLPGSRAKEIGDNLPQMLSAAAHPHPPRTARTIRARNSNSSSPSRPPSTRPAQDARRPGQAPRRRAPVQLVDDARAALIHARASVVASGTATVEAALIGNPFVVVYRVSAAHL